MDKNTFTNQPIEDQIEFINNELKEKTLTKVCEEIGMSRGTIQRNFLKADHVFSRDLGRYVDKTNKVVISYGYNNKMELTAFKEGSTDIDGSMLMMKDYESKTSVLQKHETDIMDLVDNKDTLLEMMDYFKNNMNVIEVEQLDMTDLPTDLQKDIVTKSIKVYNPVYSLFNDVCNLYPSLKKQDLVSLALYNFIKKYNH